MQTALWLDISWEQVELNRAVANPTTNFLCISDDKKFLWELTEWSLSRIFLDKTEKPQVRMHKDHHSMSKLCFS